MKKSCSVFITAVFGALSFLLTSCNGRGNDVELFWIKDNAGDKLMPLELFGPVPDSIVTALSIQDGIPSSVSVFLVKTDGKTILFDTGLGAPDSRLQEGLEAAGVSPEDIDYLYLTHFHGDHIGGMMHGGTAVFPNAEVYASQAQYDAWMSLPDAH